VATTSSGCAAAAALNPYQWRGLKTEMVVRLVIAAADGGVGVGLPVPRDDLRVEPLLAVVSHVQWRTLSVDALCRLLLAALDEWRMRDAFLDLELTWLLDEGG
jgi:hypothetical protein